jgi:hypothetical protein
MHSCCSKYFQLLTGEGKSGRKNELAELRSLCGVYLLPIVKSEDTMKGAEY